MLPLTDQQIRSSFVNASRREVAQAPVPPDLDHRVWEDLEVLGWTDPKAPQRAYVVVPTDDGLVGLLLRTQSSGSSRAAICDWCQDSEALDDVVLYVARRAGAAGRQGNTIGTMLHADLSCSRHVRRKPTPQEAPFDPEGFVRDRIAGLSLRAARFSERVRDGG